MRLFGLISSPSPWKGQFSLESRSAIHARFLTMLVQRGIRSSESTFQFFDLPHLYQHPMIDISQLSISDRFNFLKSNSQEALRARASRFFF
jgi:hypothetical protein